MTSDQIKDTSPIDLSSNSWLKEIAYQLAIHNEQQPQKTPQVVMQRRK